MLGEAGEVAELHDLSVVEDGLARVAPEYLMLDGLDQQHVRAGGAVEHGGEDHFKAPVVLVNVHGDI